MAKQFNNSKKGNNNSKGGQKFGGKKRKTPIACAAYKKSFYSLNDAITDMIANNDVISDIFMPVTDQNTGDVTNQDLLDEIFKLVNHVSARLREHNVDPVGRFYIYSTRADLDWSDKPWELVLNASNKELFMKVPDANWFRVVDSFDDIPVEYLDPATLHICNCNCKACDYCAVCRNQVIWEVLG